MKNVSRSSAESSGKSRVDSINQIRDLIEIRPPRMLSVRTHGKQIDYEMDTDASLSVINENTWKRLGEPELVRYPFEVTSYGAPIKNLGCFVAKVQLENKQGNLVLLVSSGDRENLLGRDMIDVLKIPMGPYYKHGEPNKQLLHHMQNQLGAQKRLESILKQTEKLFSPGRGYCDKIKTQIELQPNAILRCFKARNCPLPLKKAVEKCIENLIDAELIKPVNHSKWGTSIVIVLKPNGDVRICGDFKITINPFLKVDQHPLPRINDLFDVLNGGAIFFKKLT